MVTSCLISLCLFDNYITKTTLERGQFVLHVSADIPISFFLSQQCRTNGISLLLPRIYCMHLTTSHTHFCLVLYLREVFVLNLILHNICRSLPHYYYVLQKKVGNVGSIKKESMQIYSINRKLIEHSVQTIITLVQFPSIYRPFCN